MTLDLASNFEFLSNQKACAVCKLYKISTDGEGFLKNRDPSSLDFLKFLAQSKAYKDIINFIVFSLSLNLSLNWSYDCLMTLPNIDSEAAGLQDLISDWLKKPSEETRATIQQRSEIINFSNPWGLLGTAVYWSGGNISPPSKPQVLIDEKVIRSLISNSIILAALGGDATLIEERFLAFVQKGLLILQNSNKEQI